MSEFAEMVINAIDTFSGSMGELRFDDRCVGWDELVENDYLDHEVRDDRHFYKWTNKLRNLIPNRYYLLTLADVIDHISGKENFERRVELESLRSQMIENVYSHLGEVFTF